MKYLVSFYGNYSYSGFGFDYRFKSLEDSKKSHKKSLECFKGLFTGDLELKNIKEITEEEFCKAGNYSCGNCKEFDIFAEAIEFYTAVCPLFSTVVLSTTEGCIICEYHLESKN